MSVPLGRSAPVLRAGVRCPPAKAGLAVWFVGPHMSGAAEATAGGAPLALAGVRRRLGKGGEGEKEG
jgi:hypothetical protein